MDQPAGDVEGEEAERPENEQDDGDASEAWRFLLWFGRNGDA